MIERGKLLQNVDYDLYAAEPGLRSGDLQKLRRSAAHYLASKDEKDEPTPAMKFGSLFHKAIENPARFRDLMKVKPVFVGKTLDGRDSSRSKEAKQMEQDWLTSNKDSIVVTEDEAKRIAGMLKSISEHKLLSEMLPGGISEVSLWTQDPDTGVTLKCRPDFVNRHGYVIDFKTADDARDDSFVNQIFSDRGRSPLYCLQAAHYAHATKVANLGPGDMFVFVVVESEAPHAVMTYELDSGCLQVGEAHRAPLTKRFANCIRNNQWPGYPIPAVKVEIPNWVEWPKYKESEDDEKL